jgi:hypothetical protein
MNMTEVDFIIQEQIILGTLLADGYMAYREYAWSNCRLAFTHCLKQKEYALWKANQIGLPYYTYYRNRLDKRTNKTYQSIVIHFKANDIFRYYFNMFYQDKKKVATGLMISRLKPLGIAVWYCDDGNLYINKDTKILTLATNSFSDQERNYVINTFKSTYNLDFKTCSKGAIRLVSLREIKKFMAIVGPYIPNCMAYKKSDIDYKTYNNRYYGNTYNSR